MQQNDCPGPSIRQVFVERVGEQGSRTLKLLASPIKTSGPKGVLYVLTIPENATDLYSLPQPVLTAIRRYILFGFPFVVDAPSKVSLFVYDNKSFVVESFLDTPTKITIAASDGHTTQRRNLSTGEKIDGQKSTALPNPHGDPTVYFHITVQPHSFVGFAAEQ